MSGIAFFVVSKHWYSLTSEISPETQFVSIIHWECRFCCAPMWLDFIWLKKQFILHHLTKCFVPTLFNVDRRNPYLVAFKSLTAQSFIKNKYHFDRDWELHFFLCDSTTAFCLCFMSFRFIFIWLIVLSCHWFIHNFVRKFSERTKQKTIQKTSNNEKQSFAIADVFGWEDCKFQVISSHFSKENQKMVQLFFHLMICSCSRNGAAFYAGDHLGHI